MEKVVSDIKDKWLVYIGVIMLSGGAGNANDIFVEDNTAEHFKEATKLEWSNYRKLHDRIIKLEMELEKEKIRREMSHR